MYQTIGFGDFCDAFRAHGRQDQFSYEGKRALFDYLEELGEDCEGPGPGIELDVIALCCEYSEDSTEAIADNYGIDLSACEDDEQRTDTVREYLEYHTSVVGEIEGQTGVKSGGFVYACF